ncbi:hypothetical protein CEXT_220821 [Caerostris extrusa]|uniref:Aquaporin n=1 Tax=Caerostris extrusa TaxID=172846 RepID=A0AAV4SLT3_CAEEX|nr:hypothetical protein CEXT_220821 [Caerostris extrusa]
MATITLGRLDHNATIISAFGWGLALTIAITISGGISGGHVNPAVTMAMATWKRKNVVGTALLNRYICGNGSKEYGVSSSYQSPIIGSRSDDYQS